MTAAQHHQIRACDGCKQGQGGPFLLVPRVIGLKKIFCCRSRVCKVFFCCAPLGAATFRRGRSKKKNTTQGVFFFAPAPGKGRRRRSPVPARGQSKKKTPPRVCVFLLRPRRKAREGEAPLGAGTGPEQKKKHHPGFFFLPRGRSKKKHTLGGVFFLLWPRAGAQRGFSFPCLSPGPQQKQKKHPGWCFFFALAPCRHGASPSPAFPRGRSKKKNTLGGVFFFAAAPRGRSLTHCWPGWRCLPLAGVVFFLLRPRPDRAGVFFVAVAPPGRSLTSLWAGAISARPGWCFIFCCGPAGSF